ncbi:FixH family protein [Thermomonas sp.]|uniref:FixH family protein n=1 Tax=Thermomonas sp. TaxID=1971895 RepID=UPI00248942E4|nr:FixH family protein [Thermomonas sp.]MDI1252129.1 FixH family protein [Thermomonas sp.]
MTEPRRAWKEPMVWLVVALPALAVVASIALLVAAARSSGNNDMVADKVQHTGQIQEADIGPDARAMELKLGAVLQSEDGMLRVFPAGGEFLRSQPLHLQLLHPNRQDDDVSLTLLPDELGWHVKYTADSGHDWNARLSDGNAGAGGNWRLRGRLPRGQRATHLGPALDAK